MSINTRWYMDRWVLFFQAPLRPGVEPDAVGRYAVMRLHTEAS